MWEDFTFFQKKEIGSHNCNQIDWLHGIPEAARTYATTASQQPVMLEISPPQYTASTSATSAYPHNTWKMMLLKAICACCQLWWCTLTCKLGNHFHFADDIPSHVIVSGTLPFVRLPNFKAKKERSERKRAVPQKQEKRKHKLHPHTGGVEPSKNYSE